MEWNFEFWKFISLDQNKGEFTGLLNLEDQHRVKMVLKYIEDADLQRWSLPDVRAFNIGLNDWQPKINCITNPYMYQEVQCIEF